MGNRSFLRLKCILVVLVFTFFLVNQSPITNLGDDTQEAINTETDIHEKEEASPLRNQIISGDIPHDIIYIDGDAEFENQGWPGEGTKENPYKIEHLNITGDSTHNCLSILNTCAHVLIYNCTFHSTNEYSIDLDNVTNVELIKNHCYENYNSIRIYKSHNIQISDNICHPDTYASSVAIVIGSTLSAPSSNITIRNNTCTNAVAGIVLYSVYNVTVIDNRVQAMLDDGISIRYTEVGTFRNNTVEGCEMGVSISSNAITLHNNTLYDNTYGVDVDSDYNHIENNTISDNQYGIVVGGSS
ncbi:MAG: right-handed parallel beta-helix repeat-containing protein, partial [Candidatus Thorarchaeota archaeon]